MGPVRRPVATAGTLVSSDPGDTEAAWRPWNLCVTVDEPGTYGYHRRELTTPGLVLAVERFDARCRLRGLATPEHLLLVVPLWAGPRTRYWGQSVGRTRLPAMHAGGVDWIIDRGQHHVLLRVARTLIRRHLDPDLQVALEQAANAHRIPLKANTFEPIGAKLLALIDAPAKGAQTWPASALASLERDLLGQLVAAIDVARLGQVKPDTSSRRAAIERALEHLRVTPLADVTIAQLAQVAGVSTRTLEYGFRDLFNLTPLGFLQLLRLHAVRRELKAPDSAGRRLQEIADHWGFHQPGRFSGYYREAFGERPSQTRAPQRRRDAQASEDP